MNLLRGLRNTVRYAPEVFDNSVGLDYEKHMVLSGYYEGFATEHDPETGWPTRAGLEGGKRFYERARNWTPFGWWLYGVLGSSKMLRTVWVCETFDHDWQDESYGGPDSGAMGASCKRCGYSWHHQLY